MIIQGKASKQTKLTTKKHVAQKENRQTHKKGQKPQSQRAF
jgi:hypothetical protein